jgi:hypothetical protein
LAHDDAAVLPFVATDWPNGWWTFNAATPRACAYVLMLTPFTCSRSIRRGRAVLCTWPFMRQRAHRFIPERGLVRGAGVVRAMIDRYSPSRTRRLSSLIAQASNPPPIHAGRADRRPPSQGLEAEQRAALGLLAMRANAGERPWATSSPPSRKIRANRSRTSTSQQLLPQRPYKALEGYRKGRAVNTADAVSQYNLADIRHC